MYLAWFCKGKKSYVVLANFSNIEECQPYGDTPRHFCEFSTTRLLCRSGIAAPDATPTTAADTQRHHCDRWHWLVSAYELLRYRVLYQALDCTVYRTVASNRQQATGQWTTQRRETTVHGEDHTSPAHCSYRQA
jgi:hypothetical protein